jgi:hypothetical protein
MNRFFDPLRICFLVVAASLLSPLVSAEPTIVPYWKKQLPKYYSGTYCHIWALITPKPDERILRVTMKVNGEDTYDQLNPDPNLIGWLAVPYIVFDSTHFSHGTTVTSEAVVIYDKESPPESGNYVIQPPKTLSIHSAPVKNEALIASGQRLAYGIDFDPPGGSGYGTQDGIDVKNVIASAMGQANHAVALVSGTGWTSATLFGTSNAGNGALKNKSVLVFNHHGDEALPGVEDGSNFVSIEPGIMQYSRAADLISGLPPTNTSGSPPLNFVYFANCRQGQFISDWLAPCLYPGTNAYYQGSYTDQAVVAFTGLVKVANLDRVSSKLFEKLLEGVTVWSAIGANFPLPIAPIPYENQQVYDEENQTWQRIEPVHFAVGGDPNFRMKGLYTGSAATASSWWSY